MRFGEHRLCGAHSPWCHGAVTVRQAAIITALLAASIAPRSEAASDFAFYVGSHGWHTSIVVARAQIPAGFLPPGVSRRTFSRFAFIEFGWGDRKFYTAPKPNVAMAFDAVFLPGPSVLHIVGLDPPLERALPWSALVRVPCSRRELRNLCRALGETFERDSRGESEAISSGLYGATSRFYPARQRYYLLNTCDTWTARMMRAGGLHADTSPLGTWSAGAIIAQARRLAARKEQMSR